MGALERYGQKLKRRIDRLRGSAGARRRRKLVRNVAMLPLVVACWPITVAAYSFEWCAEWAARGARRLGDAMPRWEL